VVVEEPRTFRAGLLAGRESVKGFRVLATDGSAGRVSWASYQPAESYLVISTGLLRRTHRVLPAGAVIAVRDGEVEVSLSRIGIEQLPSLAHPQAPVSGETAAQTLKAFERAAAFTNIQ
jgi:hypothetical protein